MSIVWACSHYKSATFGDLLVNSIRTLGKAARPYANSVEANTFRKEKNSSTSELSNSIVGSHSKLFRGQRQGHVLENGSAIVLKTGLGLQTTYKEFLSHLRHGAFFFHLFMVFGFLSRAVNT